MCSSEIAPRTYTKKVRHLFVPVQHVPFVKQTPVRSASAKYPAPALPASVYLGLGEAVSWFQNYRIREHVTCTFGELSLKRNESTRRST